MWYTMKYTMLSLFKFIHRKSTKLVIVMAILLLVIYPFLFTAKKSYADEITLFPTECLGTWLHAEVVAGDPADSFSSFGAQSKSVGDSIVCRNFIGSLPEGSEITNSYIKLFWTKTDTTQEYIKPSIEQSYDVTPSPVISPIHTLENSDSKKKTDQSKDESNQDKNKQKIDAIDSLPPSETIKPQPIQVETPKTSEPKVEPRKEKLEPTSRLLDSIRTLLLNQVSAQEQKLIESSVNNDSASTAPATLKTDQPFVENKSIENDTSSEKVETIINDVNNTQISTEDQLKAEIKIIDEDHENNLESNSQTTSQSTPQSGGSGVQTVTGTPLFRVSYSANGIDQRAAGFVVHENLTEQYNLVLQSTDIENFSFSLERLMTFDNIEDLTLLGVGLVVQYKGIISEDPIRQPNLQDDTILDSIVYDSTQVIRLKRADKKGYEIWYRSIEPEAEVPIEDSNENVQEIIPTESETEIIDNKEDNLSKNVEIKEVELEAEKEAIETDNNTIEVTQEAQVEVLSVDQEEVSTTELISPIVSKTVSPGNKDVSNVKETSIDIINDPNNSYWNFVAGGDSVHESFPIDFRDNIIFWINKKGSVVNAFNIFTQGVLSQSIQKEDDNDYLLYFDATSQERKVMFSFPEQRFIFLE